MSFLLSDFLCTCSAHVFTVWFCSYVHFPHMSFLLSDFVLTYMFCTYRFYCLILLLCKCSAHVVFTVWFCYVHVLYIPFLLYDFVLMYMFCTYCLLVSDFVRMHIFCTCHFYCLILFLCTCSAHVVFTVWFCSYVYVLHMSFLLSDFLFCTCSVHTVFTLWFCSYEHVLHKLLLVSDFVRMYMFCTYRFYCLILFSYTCSAHNVC